VKHLLSSAQLSRDEAVGILDTTLDMAEVRTRAIKKLPTLRGKTVANVFFEDSTRTRLSFEAAAMALGADVTTFTAQGSSVSKGESLKDTLQTLEAMGAEFIVLRHAHSGVCETVVNSGWVDAHVINAGDGTHEHPTQALLDAFTMRTRLYGDTSRGRDLTDLAVVIVGDILHSRVARSNIWLLRTLGASVTVAAPITLVPREIESWGVTVVSTLDEALESQPHVVMTLRVQKERMSSGYFPSESEFSELWGMTSARLRRLGENAIVMHPGPMNRGLEIAGAVADSPQSTVTDQVANGVATRMAVLYTVMGGSR
jgi:aspartate carbamoyltransferase catalytic subunit